MLKLLFALILLTAQTAIAAPMNEIKTPDATYVGVATATGRQFLGIRYAKSPIGKMRFKAPERLASQSSVKVNAIRFGQSCRQPEDQSKLTPAPGDKMIGSEDCLFLNVYSPLGSSPKKPVMVWIHGGGYTTGSGSMYDGRVLAEKNDLIVVTINYRLSALGFLAVPGMSDAEGNLGILDQQQALQWVRRNIASFGGDPKNVTIFGESAGGHSVCTQLLSPRSKGLYQRGIIQSGLCGPEALTNDKLNAEKAGLQFAAERKCTDAYPLDCLRKVNVDELITGDSHLTTLRLMKWAPIYGTRVVPRNASAFVSGTFNRVPLIQGTNKDEGRLFAGLGDAVDKLKSAEGYEAVVRAMFGDDALKIIAEYPASSFATPALAYAQVLTDSSFSCPALEGNHAFAQYSKVFGYEFSDQNAPIPLSPTPDVPSFGAYHTAEIPYVFQTAFALGDPARFTVEQKTLSDTMMGAWASFALDGVPALSGRRTWTPVLPSLVPFKNFDVGGPAFVGDFEGDHKCAFWSNL